MQFGRIGSWLSVPATAWRKIAMLFIRPAQPDDEPFLWDMGWEATAVDAGMCALGRETAFQPARSPLPRRVGPSRDAGGVAATEDGRCLGAAWYRLFPAESPGWGFVASDVPELSIGVAADARGRGVGSALLEALLTLAREQGYQALSLTVDRQNPACRLYERTGIREAGVSAPSDTSVTMLAHLFPR